VTLTLVAEGKFAQVKMTVALHGEFRALSPAGKRAPMRRLQRYMEMYASDGPAYLSDKKFKKNEGRHPLGEGFARNVLVQAFADAPEGIRIYGCLETLDGTRFFICTVMDANKKKQKADQAKLARAAARVGMELKVLGVNR